jgi:hypothetical protein
VIVGSEIVPTKGSKGYDKFMKKHEFAFSELLKREFVESRLEDISMDPDT